MKKDKFNEFCEKINDVLCIRWDPISVYSDSETGDEYRHYAKKIVQMFNDGRDSYAIADYLRQIESGILSLPANENRLRIVVKKLIGVSESI